MEQKNKRKAKTKAEKQLEKMNRQLTEELFSIAMGRDEITGESVAIKEWLKAMEMLTALQKGGEKDSMPIQPVIIVDDITKGSDKGGGDTA